MPAFFILKFRGVFIYDALYARQMEGRLLAFALPLGSDEPARAARLLLEQVSIHS